MHGGADDPLPSCGELFEPDRGIFRCDICSGGWVYLFLLRRGVRCFHNVNGREDVLTGAINFSVYCAPGISGTFFWGFAFHSTFSFNCLCFCGLPFLARPACACASFSACLDPLTAITVSCYHYLRRYRLVNILIINRATSYFYSLHSITLKGPSNC